MLQPKLPPINQLINDICWMLNHLSTHRHLAQDVNKPTPVALPGSVSNRIKVQDVRKPQARCYMYDKVWSFATKHLSGCARTVCWHAALLKLKLVLCFRFYKEYKICI